MKLEVGTRVGWTGTDSQGEIIGFIFVANKEADKCRIDMIVQWDDGIEETYCAADIATDELIILHGGVKVLSQEEGTSKRNR